MYHLDIGAIIVNLLYTIVAQYHDSDHRCTTFTIMSDHSWPLLAQKVQMITVDPQENVFLSFYIKSDHSVFLSFYIKSDHSWPPLKS